MNRFSLTYIGIFSLIISFFSFLHIIYSYYFNLYLNLDTYFYTLLLSAFIGILFVFKKKDVYRINIYSKILTVISGFFILPLIITVPYYLSIYNLSFINSFFESISGFTSTGFSIFENTKHIDQSLILWRSSSQWIGGLYFLFSLILLIDIFDTTLKKSLTNFLSFSTSETIKQSFKILILYSTLTFVIFIILNFFNFRTFDAFNLSMTLISSGGFLPVNDLSDILTSKLKQIILALGMLVSFFSLFLSYNLISKKKNTNFFQEDFYLLIYFFFITLLFFVIFNDGDFSVLFLAITSSISNIGFSINSDYDNKVFLFLILSIIGGSFFSTSSGLRLTRLYILFKFSINEIILNAKPKNIFLTKLYLSDSKYEIADLNKFFLSFITFIISFIILCSLLTFFDLSFENSFKLSILTLMNTVNSDIHNLNDFNFEELHYLVKDIFIFFMIIGRVELLAILIILKKFFFKS